MTSTSRKVFVMSIIIAGTVFSLAVYAKRNQQPEANAKMTKQIDPPAPAAINDPQAAMADSKTESVKYVMTSEPGTEKFEDVLLLKSRTLVAAENRTVLKSVSFGLRKKAVFGLVPVRVYTLQLFAANPEKLVKTEDGFLPSLKEAGPIQLRLTFLRDLPGQKIADSFKEGLEANKVNVKLMSAELGQVMNEVAGIKKFNKEDSFSITAIWKNNQSTLLLEDTLQIKTFIGSNNLAENILSIWFGKPADGKLADLKKALIQ